MRVCRRGLDQGTRRAAARILRVLVLSAALAGAGVMAQSDFRFRPGWNQLDRDVIGLLEERLQGGELQKFVALSESLDLVRRHYLPLAGPGSPPRPQKAPFVLGSMAALFTQIGHQHLQQNDTRNAGTYSAMALKLNPNHVPAMLTLIQVYIRSKDCNAARSLIELARGTVARLRAVPAAQIPEHSRPPAQMYDAMERQLDAFQAACGR